MIYIWSRERRVRAWEGNDRPIFRIFCCHLVFSADTERAVLGAPTPVRLLFWTEVYVGRQYPQASAATIYLFYFFFNILWRRDTRSSAKFLFIFTAVRTHTHTRNRKVFAFFDKALASRQSGIAFSALFPSTTPEARDPLFVRLLGTSACGVRETFPSFIIYCESTRVNMLLLIYRGPHQEGVSTLDDQDNAVRCCLAFLTRARGGGIYSGRRNFVFFCAHRLAFCKVWYIVVPCQMQRRRGPGPWRVHSVRV